MCVCVFFFFFSKIKHTNKEGKEIRKKKKSVGKHVVFDACWATSLYLFAACVAVKFVVSKFACGSVRLHACSVHSNALDKSGQQWSLDRLTGRCALCYIQLFRERLSEKIVHVTIPKGNMGHDQDTVPDTVAVEPTFVALL